MQPPLGAASSYGNALPGQADQALAPGTAAGRPLAGCLADKSVVACPL